MKKMIVAYNLVLIPAAIASLTLVYVGIKMKMKPLLAAGIVLTILSPYLSYLVFKRVYGNSASNI